MESTQIPTLINSFNNRAKHKLSFMLNVFLTFGDEKAPDASRTRGSEIY